MKKLITFLAVIFGVIALFVYHRHTLETRNQSVEDGMVAYCNTCLKTLSEQGKLASPYDKERAIAALIKFWSHESSALNNDTVIVVDSQRIHQMIETRLVVLKNHSLNLRTGLFE